MLAANGPELSSLAAQIQGLGSGKAWIGFSGGQNPSDKRQPLAVMDLPPILN
jgi:hypothetical protein